MNNDQAPRCIVFVAYPGVGLFDIAGPQSVFWSASQIMSSRGCAGYQCVIVSLSGGTIRTAEGLVIDTRAVSDVLTAGEPAIDTLIVPGSPEVLQVLPDNTGLVEWIAAQAQGVRRIASICSGTFFLAAAGLLEGKYVTTHWAICDVLESRHPSLQVEKDAVFIPQGKVWTSGGVTSGVDLALALVENDCGRPVAMEVAKALMVVLKRPGGQPQLSDLLSLQSQGGGRFDELHLWLAGNVGRSDLSVALLARQMHMSARNFSRLYKCSTGLTPAKTIANFRVSAARRMLEDSERNIDQVACACGFGDEERMRVTFHRHLGLSPRDYRARYLKRSD